MVVSKDGMQAKRATFYVQAGYTGLGSAAIRNTLRTAGLMAGLGLLAGCQNSSSLNPVNWWHQSQGGKIAEDRPEPPGADQPYPNLNAVPGRPTAPNQEELNKLTSALVADRTNAQHEA